MRTTIQRWGNSSAVRLPKPLLVEAALREDDQVELTVVGNTVLVKKVAAEPTHVTLAERLRAARFVGNYPAGEYDTSAVGDEVFW
jgi:antitoxin MazE